MNLFTQLRGLVLLRRGVKALESIAESQATLARIAQSDWETRQRHLKPKPQPTIFSRMDQEAVERKRAAEARERRGGLDEDMEVG